MARKSAEKNVRFRPQRPRPHPPHPPRLVKRERGREGGENKNIPPKRISIG